MEKSKFQLMVVRLSGGWKTIDCDSLKESVKRSYLIASEDSCRYVKISRRVPEQTFFYNVCTIASNGNGRIWMAKADKSLSNLYWKGVIPKPEDATEITGKYELPTDSNYCI
jgi:hypothetical protein